MKKENKKEEKVTNEKKEKISIIVPCYNEQESLPIFYEEITKIAKEMKNQEFEFLFINDGSKDNTLKILKDLAKKDDRVRFISFSRNFGKEGGMYAGLENATGDYVAIMDADMQDPPSMIKTMYQDIKEEGFEAIIINNNPETVSTDYTTSDKLYFEPLTVEDVMNIIDLEKPEGVIAALGGQTAINLAGPLSKLGVKIIGTDVNAIEKAENRDAFERVMKELKLLQPRGEAVTNIEDGIKVAKEIGYPVLVRPSYVLGGRAMQIVSNQKALEKYLKTAVEINTEQPVLVDKYITGKELEVDAVCDGKDVFVPGIMEHVEKTGIHSGDSISVYPTFSVSQKAKDTILDYTVKLGLGIGIVGLYNIQFIVDKNEDVYVIEVNPRSSRTVPFISKSTGYSLADIGTLVMLGKSLKEQEIDVIYPKEKEKWYVKAPAFSFSKLSGLDATLSPEMKSTGEAIGYDKKLTRALYKALQSSGVKLANYGTVFVTIADKDKEEALPLIKRFYNLGFNIEATKGTAKFLKEHGIKTRVKKKISEGSEEILESLRKGYVSYVINTRNIDSIDQETDGTLIRRCATENNVPMLTALDTVRAVLDVLEEITLGISTIDE